MIIKSTYVLKLTGPVGNFVWASAYTGPDLVGGLSLLNNNDDCFISVTGTGTLDADPGAGYDPVLPFSGSLSKCVSILNSNGSYLSKKDNLGIGCNFKDGSGNILTVSALYWPDDVDPGPGVFNLSPSGGKGFYVAVFDPSLNFVSAVNIIGSIVLEDSPPLMVKDPSSNAVYFLGGMKGSIDLDPQGGNCTLSANGGFDVYVLKLDQNGITTSIDELSRFSQQTITIYPNPSSGKFFVTATGEANLDVVNTLGQIVSSVELGSRNNYREALDLETPGIYFLKGNSRGKAVCKKVIVNK
jgi:hypothetical protein